MNTEVVSVGLDGPMAICVKCGRPSHLAAVGGDCLACTMGWKEDEDAMGPKATTAAAAAKTPKTIKKRSAVAFEKKLGEMIEAAQAEVATALQGIDRATGIHALALAKVKTLEDTQVALAATAEENPE